MASNELRNFTQLISKLGGRDKVNKLIQYGAKIMFYVLTQRAGSPTKLAGKCSKLSAGIGNARKVDRLLKSTVEIQKVLDALQSKQAAGEEFNRYLTIVSAMCYAMYWFGDNKVFLGKLKVLEGLDLKAESVKAHRYWLVGLLIVVYLFVGKMRKLDERRQELADVHITRNGSSETAEELDKQMFLKRVQLFGYCCDVIVALNNSGAIEKIKGSKLSDGTYGVVGFVSAATVLYRMWPSN